MRGVALPRPLAEADACAARRALAGTRRRPATGGAARPPASPRPRASGSRGCAARPRSRSAGAPSPRRRPARPRRAPAHPGARRGRRPERGEEERDARERHEDSLRSGRTTTSAPRPAAAPGPSRLSPIGERRRVDHVVEDRHGALPRTSLERARRDACLRRPRVEDHRPVGVDEGDGEPTSRRGGDRGAGNTVGRAHRERGRARLRRPGPPDRGSAPPSSAPTDRPRDAEDRRHGHRERASPAASATPAPRAPPPQGLERPNPRRPRRAPRTAGRSRAARAPPRSGSPPPGSARAPETCSSVRARSSPAKLARGEPADAHRRAGHSGTSERGPHGELLRIREDDLRQRLRERTPGRGEELAQPLADGGRLRPVSAAISACVSSSTK